MINFFGNLNLVHYLHANENVLSDIYTHEKIKNPYYDGTDFTAEYSHAFRTILKTNFNDDLSLFWKKVKKDSKRKHYQYYVCENMAIFLVSSYLKTIFSKISFNEFTYLIQLLALQEKINNSIYLENQKSLFQNVQKSILKEIFHSSTTITLTEKEISIFLNSEYLVLDHFQNQFYTPLLKERLIQALWDKLIFKIQSIKKDLLILNAIDPPQYLENESIKAKHLQYKLTILNSKKWAWILDDLLLNGDLKHILQYYSEEDFTYFYDLIGRFEVENDTELKKMNAKTYKLINIIYNEFPLEYLALEKEGYFPDLIFDKFSLLMNIIYNDFKKLPIISMTIQKNSLKK